MAPELLPAARVVRAAGPAHGLPPGGVQAPLRAVEDPPQRHAPLAPHLRHLHPGVRGRH